MKITEFLYRLVEPRSKADDLRRRELIFNIILSVLIILLMFANLVTVSESLLLGSAYRGLLPVVTLPVLGVFLLFFYLSRRGYFSLSSYFLIGIFFTLAAYMSLKWGVDLVASLLFYDLAIVMAGMLLNKKFILVTSVAVGGALIITAYLQETNRIVAERYWTSQTWGVAEISAAVIIFFVIATITWLSNREIEKSILKLRKSEMELKEERNSLEVKVEQRTKELKEAQAEKMAQLYRFAEFGKISSGLFHDLINPLNAVSLNLERVQGVENHPSISETKQYVDNAVHAAKRLENLVVAVRNQLRREETKTLFVVDEEVCHVIEILSHKAKQAGVELHFPHVGASQDFKILGDAIKFNQIVLNLVSNGVDACADLALSDRWVRISLFKESRAIVMLVEDNGNGIPDHQTDKIFEPFFTTKADGRGLGIGLSMTKRIVEKDFGGTITLQSTVGKGSSFKVCLPIGARITDQ